MTDSVHETTQELNFSSVVIEMVGDSGYGTGEANQLLISALS